MSFRLTSFWKLIGELSLSFRILFAIYATLLLENGKFSPAIVPLNLKDVFIIISQIIIKFRKMGKMEFDCRSWTQDSDSINWTQLSHTSGFSRISNWRHSYAIPKEERVDKNVKFIQYPSFYPFNDTKRFPIVHWFLIIIWMNRVYRFCTKPKCLVPVKTNICRTYIINQLVYWVGGGGVFMGPRWKGLPNCHPEYRNEVRPKGIHREIVPRRCHPRGKAALSPYDVCLHLMLF